MNKVRVRFAPSPTGELHIGGLKIALTCFLLAKKNNGTFILRIEDTDRKRYVEGAMERIVKSLEWAGIKIDEGPYVQSERLDIYKKYVDQLVAEGKAYPCFCTSERLEEMRNQQMAEKKAPMYDRCCLSLSKEEIEEKMKSGAPYTVRFKIPEGKTEYEDLVFGKITVENYVLDDQVILKSDGFPTYHLAVVVDDALMEISHVVRGVEWLPSTPKHILLYKALNWEDKIPKFCHMPNILNKQHKKLSKREGSVSVEDFRKQGYPPEAIINFIALLGWNPKTEQEIFTMEELIEQFDISKMNRAGGVFDMDRLDWISAQHIKKMDENELYKRAIEFLKEKEFFQNAPAERKTEEYVKKVLSVEKERLSKFTEAGENNKFFFSDRFEIKKDDLRWKKMTDEEIKESLEDSLSMLNEIGEREWKKEIIENKLLEKAGENRGELLFPLRWALTGQKFSPTPFEVAWVLGREESLARIKRAIGLF
jgi:nondiscriminating glutamyl-tRNA synthetase